MFTPETRVVTTTKFEFEVTPKYGYPITIRDLQDTILVAQRKLIEFKGEGADAHDDSLLVRPSDEGVVIYFETDEPRILPVPASGSTLPNPRDPLGLHAPRFEFDG